MTISKNFFHNTIKSQYNGSLMISQQFMKISLKQKYSICEWETQFSIQGIQQITKKTGNEIIFDQFCNILLRSLDQKDINSYIDILTSQDLQNLRNKKNQNQIGQSKVSKSNKRYIILTYMTKQTKFHYPLQLNVKQVNYQTQDIKKIYNQLRLQLQAAKTSALNDTQQSKTENSFSINYDKKNNGKQQAKLKEIDQVRSQNQILKAKLLRLQQQAQKKKANIQIEAAIQRTKQLKQNIQTANLQLVDWKNNISDQEAKNVDLKKEMTMLHKKICNLLTTEKQLSAKKKGEETQKQLNHVRNQVKKNQTQIERLKKQMEASKAKVKELQIKAKKLTSQKNVIQKGSRRGPYSSAGSVRSFGSYNSYSSKKSYGSNSNSVSSKAKSNYSYNSYKFR